jgi:hypothetical protein
MSTTSIDVLRENIRRIQRRRVCLLRLRQICLGFVFMAALFAVLGILEMKLEFPPAGRIALMGILVVAASALVWRYIHIHRQMGRDGQRIAHYVDEQIPELEQRLMTSMEFDQKRPTGGPLPLVERLWQDTLVQLQRLDTDRVSSIRSAWPTAAAALLVLGGLFFAVRSFDDFSFAGMRVIMPWLKPHETTVLPVGLTVAPGTIKIQRGNDVMLIARVANAVPTQVDVYLQTDSVNWRRAPMTREGVENTYVYFLTAVNEDVAYYVDIGVKRSDRHRISVFDLPRVEQIEVDYVYPEYTGMKNKTIKNRGDVIAPQGTRITWHAVFNKAVAKAAVHFGDGTTLDLVANGTTARGSFIITKDATYTINVIDAEQMENDDPYEYFVRSLPDAPPTVTLIRPGRDSRVMSLEEVSIAAAAEDDYGLAAFGLNYRVAGGENREIDFLAAQKEQMYAKIHGKTTLYLEDLEVKPGDFVFYYLIARDNNRLKGVSEIVSDIYFLEVVPTEEAFRRASQQAGSGGGSGGRGKSSSALVENQKNIIAATWKLLKQHKGINPVKFEENIATITNSQRQVMQRTQLSLRRLSERLSFSDGSYQRAVDHLQQAVTHMETAIENLVSRQLEEALGPEQSALQAIMKAESESRNTMIQMARSRGGGGGRSLQNREREDLKELFEMEMGRLENRYEMPQQAAGAQQGSEKDDTLEKLRDLARRQERLNREQKDLSRRQDRMSAEQRKRRLEELRREQEELRKEAQKLSRQMSQLARRGGFRQWSDRQRQLEDAARRMQDAERNLRRQDTGGALTEGQRAFERLRGQEKEMRLDRQATVANLIDALNRKAQALQLQEQQILKKLQALNKEKDSGSPQAEPQTFREIKDVLAAKEKMQQELADAEAMLKTIGRKGRTDQPDVADRAGETLRALKTEGVKERIEESRRLLEEGWLSLSMDTEKQIEQSVERVSKRLRNFGRPAAPSWDEQLRQAAADAGGLRRELENLQKEIGALKQSNARKQRSLSGIGPQPKGEVNRAPGDGNTLERMRQRLQRSRRHAQGLAQPWTRGERWGIDARSIQRKLNQKEVEDFLSQPDLWQKLLEPVRELESTLRAEAKSSQLNKKLFLAPEETVPTPYRDLVEEYYRELSRVDTKNAPH